MKCLTGRKYVTSNQIAKTSQIDVVLLLASGFLTGIAIDGRWMPPMLKKTQTINDKQRQEEESGERGAEGRSAKAGGRAGRRSATVR